MLQAAQKLLVRHETFGSNPPHLGRKLSRTLHCGDSVELAAPSAGSPPKGLDGGGRVYRRSHISRYFPSQPGLGLVLRSIARSKTPVQLKHPVKTDGFLISLSRETAIVRHYTFAKIFLILNRVNVRIDFSFFAFCIIQINVESNFRLVLGSAAQQMLVIKLD